MIETGRVGAARPQSSWLYRIGRPASHLVPIALLYLIAAEWNGIPSQPRDSLAYHQAAAAARAGTTPFEPVAPGPHEFVGRWPYLYPPPFAAVLALAPAVDYRTFDRAWLIASFVFFWVFAAALARIAGGGWSVQGTAWWGLALFLFPGTWLSIHFANVDLIILAFVALGIAALPASGAALTFAAAVKVTPVWPLLVLLRRSPRDVAPGAAVMALLLTAASVVAWGIAGSVRVLGEWSSNVLPQLAQGQFWGESLAGLRTYGFHPTDILDNLSVSFLPVQVAVLAGAPYEGGPLPTGVRLWLVGFGIAAPLLAAWLTRRHSPGFQAAVVAATAFLAAPIVRPYVLPVLLLVVAAALAERRDRTADRGAVGHASRPLIPR